MKSDRLTDVLSDCIQKLAMAEEMLNDFRENTSLGTIISEYEARVKEMEVSHD